MLSRGFSALVLVPLFAVGVVVAGCAKRPAMTEVAAPPPVRPKMETVAPPPAPATPAQPPAPVQTPTMQPTPPPAAQAPARPVQSEFAATPEVKDIHFAFDRAEITAKEAQTLDANAKWLKEHPSLVLIEGHCDERGTNEYNVSLGERRAKAARDWLVSHGIDAARITITSFGEERPVCTEHNERCWARNRRAHFLVKQQ